MITHRREFLFAGAAFTLGLACSEDSSAQGIISPERFGARGDGSTDDTEALQRCFDQSPPGTVVRLRKGAVYLIDTNARPTNGQFGGVRIGARQIVDLNGAELRALPSRHGQGAVIQAFGADGWQIRGPGRIVGERASHIGRAGEWGMGIAVFASNGWKIGPGVEVSGCWGDGIYLGETRSGGPCDRFTIDGVRVFDCRRNGITVVAGSNGRIRSADIRDINGIAPRGGICLEPNFPDRPNRNIEISGCRVHGDVQVGVYVTGPNQNIDLRELDLEAINSGVIIGGWPTDINVTASRIRSTRGGREGAAIRFVGQPERTNGIRIERNELGGGGYFVVDFAETGYQGLVVTGNRITASNPRVQGIARMHGGTFTDNVCVIESVAGRPNRYFVYLQRVSYGGNSYRNLSQNRMKAVYKGATQLRPDQFLSSTLTSHTEGISKPR
jgi:hypothetical protein